MRKFLLSLLSGVFIVTASAQTVTIATAPTSSTQLNGLGSDRYHVSEYIYTNTEIGNSNFTTAATAINQINLNLLTLSDLGPLTFSNVKIYLKEVPAATTTFTAGTYTTAGYTEVYSGTFPATTVGWSGVNLTTPFVRTAGNNLQMMIERTDNVAPTAGAAPGPPAWESFPNVANSSRRYNGTTALSGTTSLGLSAHRVSIQFKHAVANDAAVINNSMITAGKLPVGYGGSNAIVVSVQNAGSATLTNLPVTLTVTGANAYTNTQNVASLASGATTTVTFNGYSPAAVGNNVLTVSVPSDGDNTNNSTSQNQISTATTYALSNDDAFTPGGSIGFNTGSGNLLVKMPVYKDNNLTGVRVSITTEASAEAKTVYGVLVSSTGTVLAQTPNYVIQNADLGQYVTFNFTTPVAVTNGTTYYIGLGQTANAAGYYPVNTQSDKPNQAHSTVLAGGTIQNYSDFGSLMIEGLFSTVFPVTLSSFTGVKQGSANKLEWITSTEINNAGFELQRSADGRNFSAITKVASKAEGGNSAAKIVYQHFDEQPLDGNNFYRLKQIDRDGKFAYSDVVVLKSAVRAVKLSSVYPNPAREEVNMVISSPVSEKATIVVTDLTGKIMVQKAVQLQNGDIQEQLKLGSLSSGTYLIKVICANGCEASAQRFVKQ